jgi:hypothetical protein
MGFVIFINQIELSINLRVPVQLLLSALFRDLVVGVSMPFTFHILLIGLVLLPGT